MTAAEARCLMQHWIHTLLNWIYWSVVDLIFWKLLVMVQKNFLAKKKLLLLICLLFLLLMLFMLKKVI